MLKGKTTIVTGSTSGIGLGIARALAAQGCNVMINGFGAQADIDAIINDLQTTHGVSVRYSNANMADAAQIAAMVQTAQQELGSVDIVVNNAGIQHTAPVDEFPPEKWDSIIAINLSAVFHLSRAVLPL